MIAEAEGRLLSSLAAHAGWRERAGAAVGAWRRAAGGDGEDNDDAARLGRVIERDEGMADLACRLEAHEAEARTQARDPMDGLDANFLALECTGLSIQARLDGEALPRVLADFAERCQSWREEQEKQKAQPVPQAGTVTPAKTAVAARPVETEAAVETMRASPRPAPKPAPSPQPAARVTPSPPCGT